MKVNTFCINIMLVFKHTSSVIRKFHNVTNKLHRYDYLCRNIRLFNMVYDCRIGHSRRIIHQHNFAVLFINFVFNVWNCCNDIKVVFAFESCLNNFKMKQSKKSAAESKTKSNRSLGFVR